MNHAERPTGAGIAALGGAIISVQIGASFAKELITDMANATGATWLRLACAGVVMSGIWLVQRLARRPKPTAETTVTERAAERPSRLGFAVAAMTAMVIMNWTIWEAFTYLPVGIAVTLEFLGPLTLAILGSKSRLDFLWVALAAAGVILLGFRPEPLSPVGVMLALVAATCWAVYTYCASRVEGRYTPSQLLTPAWLIAGAILTVPALATGNATHLSTPVLLGGLLVGVMNSVLPHTLELFSLGPGRVTPALFGILQSTAPAIAALGATAILQERLGSHDWAAIAMIVTASLGATWVATIGHASGIGHTSQIAPAQ